MIAVTLAGWSRSTGSTGTTSNGLGRIQPAGGERSSHPICRIEVARSQAFPDSDIFRPGLP